MNHKPGSVAKTQGILTNRHLSGNNVAVILRAVYPRRIRDGPPPAAYLTLLLMRLAVTGAVAGAEAGSYPAISPLPGACFGITKNRRRAVYFLLRFLSKSRMSLGKPPPIAALRPGVTRHHALRSPDFPPRLKTYVPLRSDGLVHRVNTVLKNYSSKSTTLFSSSSSSSSTSSSSISSRSERAPESSVSKNTSSPSEDSS